MAGHVRSLIGRMLNPEPQILPNLEELKVKEHSSNFAEEESKRLRVEAPSDFTKKSIRSIGNILLSSLLFVVIIT